VVGVGLLVARSLESIHDGEFMRHQIVADRLFDAMEEELSDLIEAEEARSFLEYRFYYAPEGESREPLTRSPLSRPPDRDYVVGYFQLEPDGALNSPRRPRDVDRAEQDYGWSDTPELQQEEQQLSELTRGLREQMAARWAARPEEAVALVDLEPETTAERRSADRKREPRKQSAPPTTKKEARPVEKAAPTTQNEARNQKAVLDTLNRGAAKRADRSTKSEPVSTDNAYFQLPEEPDAVVDADLPSVQPPQDVADAVQSLPPRGAARRDRGGSARQSSGRSSASSSSPSAPQAASSAPVEVWADEADEAVVEGEVDALASAEPAADAFAEDRRTVPPAPVSGSSVESTVAQREQATGFAGGEASGPEEAGGAAPRPSPGAGSTAGEATSGHGSLPPVAEAQRAAADANARQADASRAEKDQPAPAGNADAASRPDGDDRPVLAAADPEPLAPAQATPRSAPSPRPTPAPAASSAALRPAEAPPTSFAAALVAAGRASDLVDVRISPLRGQRVDAEHLVLHRSVRVGDLTWRQGLVLRVSELIDHLQAQVLDDELAGFVDLRWDVPSAHGPAEAPADGSFRFGHQFAAPFTALAATATLSRLPQEGRDPQSWVLLLSLLLGVVGVVGFGALYRMVSVVVQFAERRNNFVAAVSHELKTPLTAIRMYGEILREGMVASDEKRQEYYATITAESERLSRLIDNVLELSRLEKGTRSVHPSVGPIAPVLEEVARILRPHARNQGFELQLEVAPDLPSATYDRDALQQVLINLVDNALKFAGGSEEKIVTLTCERAGDGLTVRVRDRGPGVPPVQVGRVFQPFFRGERELTRRTKGTGIGLALVKGLVEQMGGHVTARNHPSGGFEVSIVLAAGATAAP
jgi:signal transduction histidine kinase